MTSERAIQRYSEYGQRQDGQFLRSVVLRSSRSSNPAQEVLSLRTRQPRGPVACRCRRNNWPRGALACNIPPLTSRSSWRKNQQHGILSKIFEVASTDLAPPTTREPVVLI